MERWTFLVIPDGGGAAKEIRMLFRAGDDPDGWPCLQVGIDGTEVPVDDVEKDFEAPEWKAIQIFTGGGGTEASWEALKERLRSDAA